MRQSFLWDQVDAVFHLRPHPYLAFLPWPPASLTPLKSTQTLLPEGSRYLRQKLNLHPGHCTRWEANQSKESRIGDNSGSLQAWCISWKTLPTSPLVFLCYWSNHIWVAHSPQLFKRLQEGFELLGKAGYGPWLFWFQWWPFTPIQKCRSCRT